VDRAVIQFERSTDYELCKRILTHPRIYDHISDDFSPDPADYEPIDHPSVWYVIVRDTPDTDNADAELLGLWMLQPLNGVCWEIHTALLPNAWGERGRRAAKHMAQWVWEHTTCRRLVTNVPENNRLALAFAEAAGMKVYGRNTRSFLKGGKLLDQILLGLSKPERIPAAAAESTPQAVKEGT
jgi:RimJ/RimL family protein N-acetyltransferase